MSALSVALQVEELIERPVRRVTVLDNAVLMRLNLTSYGTSRKVSPTSVEVDADKTRIKVTKKLLDCQEAKEIAKLDGEIRQWVYAQCLPSMIMDGMHFVPLVNVTAVNERMKQFAAERSVLVEVLCAAYEDIKRRDSEALRSNFNEADYAPVAKLRSSYVMSVDFMSLTVPRSLEAVSEEMYLTAKQQMDANIAEATAAVREVLREQFAELVTHMVDRLTPGADGKPKVFKASMISNFEAFLGTFEGRNITEDETLASLVAQARGLVRGVSPDSLRSQESLRDTVRSGMASVQGQLDKLVSEPKTRLIEID